ncbi:MAG TPA: hypothetical protein VM100_00605 [Longimicrobiales bacterium]|nr:hypothetical protein [Longimicrobiales bacterium]
MRRRLFISLVLVTACSEGTGPLDHTPQLSLSNSATQVFGPERFLRTTGKPDEYARTINTNGFTESFTLHVRSSQVASATVSVNGNALLTSKDFSQQRSSYDIAFTAAGSIVLNVALASAPGSYLEMSIDGFRKGTRFCPGSNVVGDFSSMGAAVEATPDGGTILVCDGVHMVHDVLLGSKSVTIQPEGPGRPILDGTGGSHVFRIWSPAPTVANVVVRGLYLRNGRWAPVQLSDDYGTVLLENNTIVMPRLVPSPTPQWETSGINVFRASGHGVTIKANTIVGGDVGISVGASDLVDIVDNSLGIQNTAAIVVGDAGGLRNTGKATIKGNNLGSCAVLWCLATWGVDEATIEENSITITMARRTETAIHVQATRSVVRGNRIDGIGNGDRDLEAGYPIVRAINVMNTDAVVSGNRITNAWSAIWFNNATAEITRNSIATVHNAAGGWGPPKQNVARMHENDISDYVYGLANLYGLYSFAVADFRCNYWGPFGPTAMGQGFPIASYAPWATAPTPEAYSACRSFMTIRSR